MRTPAVSVHLQQVMQILFLEILRNSHDHCFCTFTIIFIVFLLFCTFDLGTKLFWSVISLKKTQQDYSFSCLNFIIVAKKPFSPPHPCQLLYLSMLIQPACIRLISLNNLPILIPVKIISIGECCNSIHLLWQLVLENHHSSVLKNIVQISFKFLPYQHKPEPSNSGL